MNITKEKLLEAKNFVANNAIGAGCDPVLYFSLVGQVLIADAILECDKTLATIAQKVLDTLP